MVLLHYKKLLWYVVFLLVTLSFYILCGGFTLSEKGQNSVAEGEALSDL